ncbi:hypothetical protein DUI87_07500 [Hirundo rustica rustica]|uniref:Centrosome and spindle pole-associated protein 1 C-terminal domain-containing protein n=1 Tax=Hirundo rustica rustica TaxID=333673 RepID=A0A3M0KRM9_HIRRU|nr:hypothetical protein DUI87_07500 [Hirundo rustica rustica]
MECARFFQSAVNIALGDKVATQYVEMMADDLEKFIEDQKAKLAQDKAELENDPPYMEMRKNYMTTGEVDPYTQGLSLPIDERRSAKERLRLERNKEYNQYLRDKEEWNERLRKLGKKNRENEMHRNKTPIAVTRLQPELHREVQPYNTGAEPPKKDAFTSTEGCEELLNKRWLEEDRYHRLNDEVELRSRLLNKRLDGDLDVPNRRHHGFASQSVIPTRKHHRFDENGEFGRRYYRVDHDPETNAEMDPRFRYESTYDRKTPRGFYAERPYLNGMVRDVPADYEDELKERAHVRPFSRAGDSRWDILGTFLIIALQRHGGQDRELLQRRKEKYRQELMEQMAEQQRNRRREKELELSVAASGAQDPEKKANRLKQFGFTARAFEEKAPPERPRVAFQTPMPARSASPVNEDSQSDKDFQRGLVSSLGKWQLPDGTGMMGMQPTPSLDLPLGQAPVEQPVSNIVQRNTGDRQRSIGMYSEEKTKPSKEATLSYQQELQQQIREREERRRQEREEKEKLEAEMRNYNPWGRGGGGAPLKDAEGNLIKSFKEYNPSKMGNTGYVNSDLNIMHRRNEEAYHNPEARLYEDKRAIVDLSLASSRPENSEASTNKTAGITFAQASPFARGNVFGEPPSPEQLKRQESYKNFLRLQIEEKRRREEAERERLRIEEEKEEKRLAEQRMRIQKAYEEELEERRRKDEERRLKNKEVIQLDEERRKEAEKQGKEKEQKQEEQLRQYFEKEKMEEEKKMLSRQPSPVIPALQNKSVRKEERIPSAESRLSYYAQGKKCKFHVFALDPETRMGLRHMYPDPPKDDQTLEIQQQALLREQQRKLDRMRMRRETEAFHDRDDSALDSYPQTMGLFRNESNEFQKNSLLESDSAFIGANGETFSALEEVNLLPRHPSSARERRRLKQRALESAVHEEVPPVQTPVLQPDSFSLHSNFSLDVDQVKGKNEERLHRLTELQQKSPSLGDDISLGDVDDLLKRAQSQASSTDTVATEPWLRPGTSATLRRLAAEQPSPAKLSAESALPLGWHGLSTAHG